MIFKAYIPVTCFSACHVTRLLVPSTSIRQCCSAHLTTWITKNSVDIILYNPYILNIELNKFFSSYQSKECFSISTDCNSSTSNNIQILLINMFFWNIHSDQDHYTIKRSRSNSNTYLRRPPSIMTKLYSVVWFKCVCRP